MGKKVEFKTVSLDEFQEKPGIGDLFPLRFTNGTQLREITCECAKCKQPLDQSHMRGTLIEEGDEESYRTSRTIRLYYFDGQAYCEPCNCLTPIRVGILDDLTMVIPDGKYLNFYGKPRTRWQRVRVWFRRLFRRN